MQKDGVTPSWTLTFRCIKPSSSQHDPVDISGFCRSKKQRVPLREQGWAWGEAGVHVPSSWAEREMWEEELGALAFQQRAPGGAQALLQPQSSSGRGLVEWTLSGVLNSEAHTTGILWDDYWTCLSLVSHCRKETITTSQSCYKDYREYCMLWGWHIIWHIEGTWEMVVDTLNFHYYFEYWPVSWLWYGNGTLLFTQMIIGYFM